MIFVGSANIVSKNGCFNFSLTGELAKSPFEKFSCTISANNPTVISCNVNSKILDARKIIIFLGNLLAVDVNIVSKTLRITPGDLRSCTTF